MRNRVPTRDILWRRRILAASEQGCTANCGNNEDIHHLFVKCGFFLAKFCILFVIGSSSIHL